MPPPANPAYIDRCGEQVFAPPFNATLKDFYVFGVQADNETLNDHICDRYFNQPLGYGSKERFTAFQYVFFVFSNIDAASSQNEKYSERGVFSYREVAIWMLVADHETYKIRWFVPYIFVDNPYALHPGREIYGFPKTMGAFRIPSGPNPPDLLWTETILVKKEGGAGQTARLLEVGLPPDCECKESHHGTKQDLFTNVLRELQVIGPEYLEKFGLTGKFAMNAYEELLRGEIPLMFIKQFRDGVNPSQASGLIIQEADSQIISFDDARIYTAPYEIAINDVYSHPIRRDLGLDDGQLKCALAFWMRFKFSLGRCIPITEHGAT